MNDIDTEAASLLRIAGRPLEAYLIIERQLTALVLRTQVLLSLSGIVITVTGFSGRQIAQTGPIARVCISAGIVVVLAAAVTALAGVLKLRWLSQTLVDDPLETIIRGLVIRDGKSRLLSVAMVLFAVGFSLYVAAVTQLLMMG